MEMGEAFKPSTPLVAKGWELGWGAEMEMGEAFTSFTSLVATGLKYRHMLSLDDSVSTY